VRAGIDVLAATIGRKLLVLGDMGEIGEASGQYHDEIGGYAKSAGRRQPVRAGRRQCATGGAQFRCWCAASLQRKSTDLIEALRQGAERRRHDSAGQGFALHAYGAGG
jgi:UDP-N-acetylmuramyl pentapeptide synthase